MRKILFISSSLSYGGAEKMLCFVANGLSDLNDHVIVINLNEHPDNAGRLNDNVDVINIDTTQLRFVSRIDQFNKIVRTIRKIKPDIIISFKYIPNYLAVAAGKLLRVPVIISERCDPEREYSFTGHAKLYWKIINAADGAVFQTTGAMKCYSERIKMVGTVIPNPVVLNDNISHIVRKNEESKVIVSVGRLSNVQKRYDVMIQAFCRFHKKNPEYILRLYGDGEDESIIREWISEYGLEESVYLEGKTDSPLQAMDDADIFLTTSDYEGISNSLLEAMAIGMPVIATDCSPGGARLLIKNEENGLLVPCGKEELVAEALNKMALDYLLRYKCGTAAKTVQDEYCPQHIIEMWNLYITNVIKEYKKHSIIGIKNNE